MPAQAKRRKETEGDGGEDFQLVVAPNTPSTATATTTTTTNGTGASSFSTSTSSTSNRTNRTASTAAPSVASSSFDVVNVKIPEEEDGEGGGGKI